MMLLDVAGVYIDDEALVDGYIDPVALKSVGKLGGDEFAKTTDIFSLKRPSL